MTGTVEFSGSSHEVITKEIYEKQIRCEMMSQSRWKCQGVIETEKIYSINIEESL